MNKAVLGLVTLSVLMPPAAHPLTVAIEKNNATILKAARAALTAEGYEILYVDPQAGRLRTKLRDITLTPKQANCGSFLGMSYLRDSRTETKAGVEVVADDKTASVTVEIDGVYKPGYGNPDKPLDCVSLGVIEIAIADHIQRIGQDLPDDAAPDVSVNLPPPTAQTTLPVAPEAETITATPEPEADALVAHPRSISEAAEIFNASLNLRELNYRNAVQLSLNYQNKTRKKIIGVITRVTVTNAFGKVVLSEKIEDEVAIEPGSLKAGNNWYWEDNRFIDGEPYDRLWPAVQNDTAVIKTKILKVIFADGTSLEAPPPARRK